MELVEKGGRPRSLCGRGWRGGGLRGEGGAEGAFDELHSGTAPEKKVKVVLKPAVGQ